MTQNAPSRGQSVEQALAATHKKSTRNIAEPAKLDDGFFSYLRNAAVGMALSYLERLDVIFKPLWFSLRHLGVLLTALLHVCIPLIAAWFASHWSVRMELAVWSGSSLNQVFGFFLLWVATLITWSIFWLACRAVMDKIKTAMSSFAQSGEHYLSRTSTTSIRVGKADAL